MKKDTNNVNAINDENIETKDVKTLLGNPKKAIVSLFLFIFWITVVKEILYRKQRILVG